ncbi:NmrA family NAD(P)-binding protein [Variovorax sp.]|uniref:NmrA family NAD(P)-binding protein n=1 Tax=Variovorax sp. TaxID=1871043 RepID=UPI0037DA5898
MTKTILITAASGQTGTRLIRQLVARGVRPRALVKRAASAERVRSLGAEPVIGNEWDSADLLRAMEGADSVYHIAPSLTLDEPELGRRMVAAASRAGVSHFVLHGVIAPYLDNINYHWAKQIVQRELYRSGLPYTVLLPTNFMQNVSWTWPSIARDGRWLLPYDPARRLTWVDLDDVAEAAAIVLTEPGHALGTYELVGTDAYLSRTQIAALMAQALGRPVVAVKESPEAYLAHARGQPFFERFRDEEVAQILAMFDDYDRHGMPAGNARVLSMLLGRPARGWPEFLASLRHGGEAARGVTSYGLGGA